MSKYLIFGFLAIFFLGNTQEKFSLDTYLSKVLEQDYGIRISKNQFEQAKNSNNLTAAGFLPTIGINADQNWTINSTRQEFLSGQTNEANNALNQSFNAGALMSWTFFDGFNMFLEDKKLDLLEENAKFNLAAEMEMKIYQAAMAFYTLLLLEEKEKMYKESIDLSKARLNQIETKKKLGSANDLEWHQAKLDLNVDSAFFLQNKRAIQLLKSEMNALIAKQPESAIQVQGIFPSQFEEVSWDEIKEKGVKQNSSILQAKSLLAISEKEHQQLLSRYYPQMAVYGGYNFSEAENQVGFLLSNRTYGPQFGITLRWDILNGLSRMYLVKNSKIEISNSKLLQEQRENTISSELYQAYLDYEWSIDNLKFEEQNIATVENSAKIINQALVLGSVTPLQLREFQFSVVQAKTRYIEAKMQYITAQLNIYLGTSDFSKLLKS